MRPIDADEVTKDLALFKYSTEYGEAEKAYIRALNKCSDEIEDAPTLDMKQVVHAHWIHDHDVEHYGIRDGAYWQCSSCGRILKDSNWFSYCPICGARMDGKDNE